MKRKELLDKFQKEANQIIYDDEDDKYLMDVHRNEKEAESYLDKEKKKAEQKNLKLVDHSA